MSGLADLMLIESNGFQETEVLVVKGGNDMNTVHLAVSVKRSREYDPLVLCCFIEHWAASNDVPVKVSIEDRRIHDCQESGQGNTRAELLFLKVDYDNYPTMGNYLIEIQQFIKAAAGLFGGIECVGINEA